MSDKAEITITVNSKDAKNKISNLSRQFAKFNKNVQSSGRGRRNTMFGSLAKGAKIAFGAVVAFAKKTGKIIASVFKTTFGLVLTGLKTFSIAAVAAVAAVFAGFKALQPAGFVEAAKAQLDILLRSSDKAQKRLEFLFDFAEKTPFTLQQVIEGAKSIEALGFFSRKAFTIISEAASVTQQDIRNVALALQKIRGGQIGLARKSLINIGVNIDEVLKEQLGKGRQLIDQTAKGGKKAFDAVMKFLERRFGGTFKRLNNTFNIAFQNLKDKVFRLFAAFGKPILPGATASLQAIGDLIGRLRLMIDKIKLAPIGLGILTATNTAIGFLENLLNKGGRQKIVEGIKESFFALPMIFKAGAKLFAVSFAAVITELPVLAGGFISLVATAIREAFTFGSNVFKAVGTEFVTNLKLALPLSGGREQARLSQQARLSGSFGDLQAKFANVSIDDPAEFGRAVGEALSRLALEGRRRLSGSQRDAVLSGTKLGDEDQEILSGLLRELRLTETRLGQLRRTLGFETKKGAQFKAPTAKEVGTSLTTIFGKLKTEIETGLLPVLKKFADIGIGGQIQKRAEFESFAAEILLKQRAAEARIAGTGIGGAQTPERVLVGLEGPINKLVPVFEDVKQEIEDQVVISKKQEIELKKQTRLAERLLKQFSGGFEF